MTRREKIDAVVRDVLAPLLEKDGAGISVVRFEGSVLTLRLTGALPGCPGTPYVKRGVIEPAIRAAVGRDVERVPALQARAASKRTSVATSKKTLAAAAEQGAG